MAKAPLQENTKACAFSETQIIPLILVVLHSSFKALNCVAWKKEKKISIFKQQMLGSFKVALLGIITINGLNRITIDRNHM